MRRVGDSVVDRFGTELIRFNKDRCSKTRPNARSGSGSDVKTHKKVNALPSDTPTDRWTDTVGYGVVCTRLKNKADAGYEIRLIRVFEKALLDVHGLTDRHSETDGRKDGLIETRRCF